MSELLATDPKPNQSRRRTGEALAAFLVFGLVSACGADTGAAESQPATMKVPIASSAPSPAPAAKLASHAPITARCQAENPDDWRAAPSNLRVGPIALLLGADPYTIADGTMVTAACNKGVSRSAVEGTGAVVAVDHIPPGHGLSESELCLMLMIRLGEPSGKLVYHVAGVCPASDE